METFKFDQSPRPAFVSHHKRLDNGGKSADADSPHLGRRNARTTVSKVFSFNSRRATQNQGGLAGTPAPGAVDGNPAAFKTHGSCSKDDSTTKRPPPLPKSPPPGRQQPPPAWQPHVGETTRSNSRKMSS
mmetsp:Transcript_32659/g.90966  ORF Transcript_32659/g.90966 Transcript_32659/m.90966 type:complete len:130 (-) Transcript_32659:61-450(-)